MGLQILSLTARLAMAKKLLGRLTGPNAEKAAKDLDHMEKYHRPWYRSVQAGRNFLKADKHNTP